MAWIQKLYETYENCAGAIAETYVENEVPLLPICHTTQKAQIEITIDLNGKFSRAQLIAKDNSRTIIPCTEDSGGRTSGPVAHPLCDKLQYVALDYKKYGGNKESQFALYEKQLFEWCESEYFHQKACAILKYVRMGTAIKDLIASGILVEGDDGKLLFQRNVEKAHKETLDIFDLLPGRLNAKGEFENWQAEAFVRWVVEVPGEAQSAVWSDKSLHESWKQYYSSTKDQYDLCYVTGESKRMADQHPAKIRNDGDKAKLVSSNDTSGFTFRGRYQTAEEACGVGFEATQKAHSALRWLISRQGYKRGDQAIVAWATSGVEILDPMDDGFKILGFGDIQNDEMTIYTAQELGVKLKSCIAGYGQRLGDTSEIVVLGLDSATPGRMALTYYRELAGSDFIKRIASWHTDCSWYHSYRSKELINKETGKKMKVRNPFVGAPAPNDIAESAFGPKIDDRLRKSIVERLLPCIIDGQRIPKDIVLQAVHRASNRVNADDWEWNKTLSIACALFRKYRIDTNKEVYSMSLDENRRSRDYLYGRLLALADSLEQWALQEAGENRPTNAARYMQRFSERPFSTWRSIELSLAPSKARLGNKSNKRQNLISEVMSLFYPEEYTSDKKLSGEFLLGYHCQREALKRKHTDELE